jgi:glycine/serine hydroxymethyltransferase
MNEVQMAEIARLIGTVLKDRDDDAVIESVRKEVAELCGAFDPYASLVN